MAILKGAFPEETKHQQIRVRRRSEDKYWNRKVKG